MAVKYCSMEPASNIEVDEEGDGRFRATHSLFEVTETGESREEAVENLLEGMCSFLIESLSEDPDEVLMDDGDTLSERLEEGGKSVEQLRKILDLKMKQVQK